MKSQKWVQNVLRIKILLALFFSAGVFLSLLADFVWLHQNLLSTAYLWKLLVLSAESSLIQWLILEHQLPAVWSERKRCVLHCTTLYVVILLSSLLLGLLPALNPLNLLLFTAIYAVIYATLFWVFQIYYTIMRGTMNEHLQQYKGRKIEGAK